MYSRSPSTLRVSCQWKPTKLSDLSAPFHGAGSTAGRRLCVRSARRYLDYAKIVGVFRDGHDNSECAALLRHIDPRNRLAGSLGKNLDAGRECIPGGHTGQSAIAGVTGVDVVAGVLDAGEIGSGNRHLHRLLTDEPHLISLVLEYQTHSAGWRRLIAFVHRHVLTSS